MWQREIARLLPDADIQHVGATAIPGAQTKGDLDINVRVASPAFSAADGLLALRFERNAGSLHTATLSSFRDDRADPPLGVQLTARGSIDDCFIAFRDGLRADLKLLAAYNALKRASDGMAMAEYRAQKSAFVERVLADLRGAR